MRSVLEKLSNKQLMWSSIWRKKESKKVIVNWKAKSMDGLIEKFGMVFTELKAKGLDTSSRSFFLFYQGLGKSPVPVPIHFTNSFLGNLPSGILFR